MNPSKQKHVMRKPKHFFKANQGIALLEFALITPFLLFLVLGGIEVTRVMYMQQRLEKSGYVVADIITRYLPATKIPAAGQINEAVMDADVFPTYGRIMGPEFLGGPIQAIIATSIVKQSGVKRIMWQKAFANNTLSGCDTEAPPHCVKSIVNGLVPTAISGAVVNTPTSFPAAEEAILTAMPDGDNLIIVEEFYYYTPILQPVLQGLSGVTSINFFIKPRIFIKRTYATPRNGSLIYLPPTFPAP